MAAVEKKSFAKPDETMTPFEKVRVDVATIGGLTFKKLTVEPGWQWTKHVKPVVGGKSCQAPHVMLVLSGRQIVRMDDGTETELGPGDIAVIPPGHDPRVVGNEPNVLIELTDAVRPTK